ncbi:MAG: FHA domain-containing protein, partial [Planctomycetaceae bacterium]|nr:FHA domain-containing protein [Planctomycetaceae bacterium]
MAILSSFSLKPPRGLTSSKPSQRTSFRLTFQIEGKEVTLESFEPMVVLGRAKTCDVVIPLAGVSRNHAMIERDDEGWVLIDTGSTYGTFLNCERISRKRLTHGDKVNLGPASRIPVTLRFEIPDHEPPPPKDDVVFDEAAANVSMVINVEDFQNKEPTLAGAGIIGLFSQVGEALLSSEDLDSMLEHIAELTLKNLPAQRSVVCLYDESTGELCPKASRSELSADESEPIAISQSIAKQAIEARTSVLIDDALADENLACAASIVQQDIRSAMCAPMYHNGSVTGLIYVDTNDVFNRFEESHLQVLTALAVLSALGVEQERLRRDILQEKAIRDRLARYSSPSVVERIVANKQSQMDEMLA